MLLKVSDKISGCLVRATEARERAKTEPLVRFAFGDVG
jgi:hypothetical protein